LSFDCSVAACPKPTDAKINPKRAKYKILRRKWNDKSVFLIRLSRINKSGL
jgi:hypothetical protein